MCGTVKAPADDEGIFIQGVSNNLSTDTGIGFVFIDDSVTEWREVDPFPAGSTKSACDIWDGPDAAATVVYAINNFQEDLGVYRVDLPAN